MGFRCFIFATHFGFLMISDKISHIAFENVLVFPECDKMNLSKNDEKWKMKNRSKKFINNSFISFLHCWISSFLFFSVLFRSWFFVSLGNQLIRSSVNICFQFRKNGSFCYNFVENNKSENKWMPGKNVVAAKQRVFVSKQRIINKKKKAKTKKRSEIYQIQDFLCVHSTFPLDEKMKEKKKCQRKKKRECKNSENVNWFRNAVSACVTMLFHIKIINNINCTVPHFMTAMRMVIPCKCFNSSLTLSSSTLAIDTRGK